MALTRLQHWAERGYHDFLIARAKMPFAWQSNDCCMFPADAIQVITGTDIAADFRAKYTDEASALAAIKTIASGATVADAAAYCAAKFRLVEWLDKAGKPQPLMAQRGDLVVMEDAGRLIAGVVHLNGRDAVSVGVAGLKRLPLTSVTRAWHY